MADRERTKIEKASCPHCGKQIWVTIPAKGKHVAACPCCNLRVVTEVQPDGSWVARKPVVLS